MNDTGIGFKDVFVWILGLVAAMMGLLFKSHGERIKDLEQSKADSRAVEDKFADIIARLDRQDERSDKRDDKLDTILSRLPNGRRN